MRLAGEDRRDVPKQGFIVERFASADLVSIAAEPGGELVIHGLSFRGSGLERGAALQPWPSPRPG